MAKDLIRTRHQITKFYGLKSQLQGISLRIQVSVCAGVQVVFLQLVGKQRLPLGFSASGIISCSRLIISLHVADVEVNTGYGGSNEGRHQGYGANEQAAQFTSAAEDYARI